MFQLAQQDEQMYQAYMGQLARDEVQQTTLLILRFVADVKQVDGIAEWNWRLVEPLLAQQSFI